MHFFAAFLDFKLIMLWPLVNIAQGILSLNSLETSLVVNFTASNRTTSLSLGVDRGFIADGIPFVEPSKHPGTTTLNFTAERTGLAPDPNLLIQLDGWSHLHLRSGRRPLDQCII